MITKLKAIIFAIVFIAPSAFAGYTTMTIEGVQQANGVWTAAGVMDTQGFVRTTGAVTVAGAVRNLPIAATVDVPAASKLLKLGSKALGPVALAATAIELYNWATSGDITSSGNEWVLRSNFSSDYGYTIGSEWYASGGGFAGSYSSPASACQAYNQSRQGTFLWSVNYKVTMVSTSSYNCKTYSADWVYTTGNIAFGRRACTNSTIQSCQPITTVTDADFLKLPNPSLPLLSSGWAWLPSLSGQPVPITGIGFTPFSEWMDDPYFRDGNWYRDRMDVSPAPTPSQPNRVRIDIGPVKIEGATDPQTAPDTGSAGGSPPKEKPSFCEANPQSIACAELGKLEDETLEVDERPVDVSYTPWGSSNSQCPADKHISLWEGDSIAISYSPICQLANLLRPLVIALAFVSAGFIVAGVTRKSGGDA